MRRTILWIVLSCCVFSVSLSPQVRKPGLWEISSTMTWKQSPFPAGVPAGASSAFGGAPHVSQVCLTQQQIDKYGGPVSESRECQVINIVKSANGMKAEMVCTGHMKGKGTVESTWEGASTKGKVHFVGTMQTGPQSIPVEWTSESTSTYESPDCGSVKPLPTSVQ